MPSTENRRQQMAQMMAAFSILGKERYPQGLIATSQTTTACLLASRHDTRSCHRLAKQLSKLLLIGLRKVAHNFLKCSEPFMQVIHSILHIAAVTQPYPARTPNRTFQCRLKGHGRICRTIRRLKLSFQASAAVPSECLPTTLVCVSHFVSHQRYKCVF